MRIYKNFEAALNEIQRDLKEMGVKVHTSSYQNKFIGDKAEFETLEITNYSYMVTNPISTLNQLKPTQPWADAEFEERIGSYYLDGKYHRLFESNDGPPLHRYAHNPGFAWKHRPEVWSEFIRDDNGEFDYTYSDRFNSVGLIDQLIENIKADKASRQHYLAMWDPQDLSCALGTERIPCTLGYLFHHRQGALDITYLQRSADFATHFHNDLYLACMMLKYIANATGCLTGNFHHWLGSLHVFAKDVEHVF